MEVTEHKTFLKQLREIDRLESEAEDQKVKLLRANGWTCSSAYADCHWRWAKEIEGKMITTTSEDEALRLEERISSRDEDCNHDD